METDSHYPASALCSTDASRIAAAVKELGKLKRYADEHEIQMRQLEDDIRLLSQIVIFDRFDRKLDDWVSRLTDVMKQHSEVGSDQEQYINPATLDLNVSDFVLE
ncbi:hypothetical protein JX266_014425 [Neoarthrinium moseri]|nr:hypothetical protein JX266_014425 [Neoarthrinium moseri]